MRKIILVVILALSIFLCYTTVVDGVKITDTITIPNFEEIENSSKSVDTLISQLVNINDMQYQTEKSNLSSAIKSYQDAKEEYEDMASIVETAEEDVDISMVDIYDVDFLWTVIGNYATEEGIKLKFDVTRSMSSSLSSSDYTMCDLKFTITGDYIAMTEFVYDIEDDNKLAFEISNFEILKGGDNLQATFTVKNVPVNNENLTELQTSVETTTTDTNTTGDNSISEATGNTLQSAGDSLGQGKLRDTNSSSSDTNTL